jgi:menaquinone-dependent protoporphyrinogen IX oxidase
MEKTLILYESKYGFTEKVAKWLSLILGPAKCCKTSEFKGDGYTFQNVVICTPIYAESAHPKIIEFALSNADWLRKGKVILICTCLAKNMEDKYLKALKDIIMDGVVLQSAIGGELDVDRISSADYDLMKQFCYNTGFSLNNYKAFNKDEFAELALNIKKLKDEGEKNVNEQVLKNYIEDFIKNHNTCTLATGCDDRVRSTPIEYIFMDGFIYIISEGGEKFLNLILNPNVSICIYDPYKSMNELGGMQIMGNAEMVDIGSGEYISVLKEKSLKYENIISLPFTLNLIKVNIKKIEFLWSEFRKLGYDAKQIFYK